MSFPLIAWVHSPIGYEAYLSFKANYPDEVKLILARNMVSVSKASVELPGGLYWNDSEQQIMEAALGLKELVAPLINNHKGYILLVPQTAVPYIRMLVESEFCKGFIYYDEGSMCHDINQMSRMSRPVHHRYRINWSDPLRHFAEALEINAEKFSLVQSSGVPLLSLQHEKMLGCVSFFKDAFPTLKPLVLELTEPSVEICNYVKDVFIILLPPKNLRTSVDSVQFENSIQTFLSIKRKDFRTVVKLHPNDRWNLWSQLNDFEFDPYENFIEECPGAANREVAFLPFLGYLSSPNSTSVFLKKLKKSNLIVCNV